jgi:hypothetical protein
VLLLSSFPGFTELGQDDQIRLIKQGSFEVVLIRYTPLFSPEGMFTPNFENRISLDKLMKVKMGRFFKQLSDFANLYNQLKLQDGEVALLTSLMIMNPGEWMMNALVLFAHKSLANMITSKQG